MEEADYPPWPATPPEAKRDTDWLHFYGPDGQRAAVPITGPKAWGITDNGDGTVTVAPSIHLVGSWHSPNPVTFRLVADLVDPRR